MNVFFLTIFIFHLNFVWAALERDLNKFTGNDTFTDYLLCRECGSDITPLRTVINIPSPFAVSHLNTTIFGLEGVLIQNLRSGVGGPVLEVITVSRSTCVGSSTFSSEDSWFPGFVWRPCLCSRCLRQVGWVFDLISVANDKVPFPSSYGFYGLMVKSIINELYADNLLFPVI